MPNQLISPYQVAQEHFFSPRKNHSEITFQLSHKLLQCMYKTANFFFFFKYSPQFDPPFSFIFFKTFSAKQQDKFGKNIYKIESENHGHTAANI